MDLFKLWLFLIACLVGSYVLIIAPMIGMARVEKHLPRPAKWVMWILAVTVYYPFVVWLALVLGPPLSRWAGVE